MHAYYGHQNWWPGDTPFEVCIGAILTQNTNWRNVEKAIANLKSAGVLSPFGLHALPLREIADMIRPAGYFNIKAGRLRAFVDNLVSAYDGNLIRFLDAPTDEARERLLGIKGIGPETADSILLYAGGHRSFVIDAYTKRIFLRHNWCSASDTYDDLQALCSRTLELKDGDDTIEFWQDYHAQLVNIGKDFCKAKAPLCRACPLKGLL